MLPRTDRGDIVKLVACGPDLLGYTSREPDVSYPAPISFEALGLTES